MTNVVPLHRDKTKQDAQAIIRAARNIEELARRGIITGLGFQLTQDGQPIADGMAGELERDSPLARSLIERIAIRLRNRA